MSKRITIEKNIQQDVNGIYYVSYSVGSAENRKRQWERFDNLEDARIARDTFALKKAKKKKIKAKVHLATNETLSSYIDYFLETVVATDSRWGPNTLYNNKCKINSHIRPVLGKIKLNNLTLQDINKFTKVLVDKGLSNSTIIKVQNILNVILGQAAKERKLEENPMQFINTIKVQKEESAIFTVEEVQKLLEVTKGHTLELPLYLAVFLGLRRAEITGLIWSDVDFANKTITINRTRNQIGKEIVIKDPKTEKSKRVLGIPESLLELLEQEKYKQEENKQIFGKGWGTSNKKDGTNDLGYIFCKPDGELYRPNYLSNYFPKFLERNNITVRNWHCLRHTFASIAVQDNTASILEISRALGHSNVNTTTKIYTHLLEEVNSRPTNSVADVILNKKQSEVD